MAINEELAGPSILQATRGSATSRELRGLILEALALFSPTAFEQSRNRGRLAVLAERLEQRVLQIAVIGQFKRGKSTLLNALLGVRLLPSAVTPLTAIPTFIRYGERLRLVSEDEQKHRHEESPADLAGLEKLLDALVTEDGNPDNRLNLARVDVELPSQILSAGIALMDTPGIGSTYSHNTRTAEEALPECDVALFVVSPDPPLTEGEAKFLRAANATAAAVIIVLNKIDIVEGRDRERSEDFLRTAAMAAIGPRPLKFFSVSARAALDAKLRDDNSELKKTGLPALEEHLSELTRSDFDATLQRAVRQKALTELDQLAFQTELLLAARKLPLEELYKRLEAIRRAEVGFNREREIRADLLAGDRRRLLADLDVRTAQIRQRAQVDLRAAIKREVARGHDRPEILRALFTRMSEVFRAESETADTWTREQLERVLRVHQCHADEMVTNARQLASDIMEIPFRAPQASKAFIAKRVCYLVTSPRETLASAPSGLIERLLPSRLRHKILGRRIEAMFDDLIIRNAENLRWALHQNIQESIRQFNEDLDDVLESSQDAIHDTMIGAIERRNRMQAEDEAENANLSTSFKRLQEIIQNLRQGPCVF